MLIKGAIGTHGHPFAGIVTKLQRADENIAHLHAEIMRFFEDSDYPVIPNPNDRGWQEAVDYHAKLRIPLRFSVLAGETVHHLRSSLDHIAWVFSSDDARLRHENALGFPILEIAPADKKEVSRYERQIQGIDNARVKQLILELQPYQPGNGGPDNPLCIVHNMDRFDKHRELVIVDSCANVIFPGANAEIAAKAAAYAQGKTLSAGDVAAIQRAVKQDAVVLPQVAFAKFGNRGTQFIVPALNNLLNAVSDVVELFAKEI
jgi:hypothetical protein